MHWRRVAGIALGVALLRHGVATAQAPRADFAPLLASPREPAYFAAYLWGRSARLGSHLGAVGLGQTIGLIRVRNWDVAIAAGVFSQFRMESATNDLINTDYVVGIPVTYRGGGVATRFRLYHQSSHLGDEYLLRTGTRRTDLTFEAAELLISHEAAPWRVYGGGEYAFAHSPSDLKPGVLRAGIEYRAAHALVRLGRFVTGHLVAGLDVVSVETRRWQAGVSAVTGLELETLTSGWSWSLLLKAYTGPTPYGQFYGDQLSSLGIGISFAR
jgi:hypothetical protein